jgi:aspartyl-tRNA synthetase
VLAVLAQTLVCSLVDQAHPVRQTRWFVSNCFQPLMEKIMAQQPLRTQTCGALRMAQVGERVRLMGWVARRRDFGQLAFIDLRDHYGITQIVVPPDRSFHDAVKSLRPESVIAIEGTVQKREGGANVHLATGEIEVIAEIFHLESAAEILPFPVTDNPKEEGEESRLRHRYLDLRTDRMHRNIAFRSDVVAFLRGAMISRGFREFQTPILTSSSPEGARDFLVPSRLHPGQFYALPQAPQQFKQLIMCSGFDRYFQIAPCFRDEDPRADRSPGDFYQLDIEMSFVTQDDVLDTVESVMIDTFSAFSNRPFQNRPFPRLQYAEALARFGSDKPDIRYGLEMVGVEEVLAGSSFKVFQSTLVDKGVIRAIRVPGGANHSRKFFDDLEAHARSAGLGGLPYLTIKDGEWKGSVAKFLTEPEKTSLIQRLGLEDGDAAVFILGQQRLKTLTAGGKVRTRLGEILDLNTKNEWAFLWVVDYPLYEWNEDEQKIDFSHNPFSMPQGGLDALNTRDPLDVLAFQYDLVCNGIELSSGAIRNHRQDVMKRAFEIAGYAEEVVVNKFPALWNAFRYGAPPHGGIAPGVDRIVMLLLDEPNIREVIMFPLNQRAQDVMMNAPSHPSPRQLDELKLAVRDSTK